VRTQRQLEAAAMREVVQASKQLEREQAQLQARAAALKASYDPLAASIDRVNKEMAEAQALAARGAISDAELGRAKDVLGARLTGLTKLQTAAATGAKLHAHEIANLGSQFADVAVSLGSGQNPLLVFLQQGSQIGGVFASASARGVGFGAALRGIASSFGPLVLSGGLIGLAVVALGALTAAFVADSNEAAKYANTLKAVGGAAGVTGDQLSATARKIADDTDAGMGKAREAVIAAASSGKLFGDQIGQVGEIAIRLSDLTGKSAAAIADDFAGMGDDVVGFATKFNAQYHVITAAQFEHIRLLQEQGATAAAQAEFIAAAQASLAERGNKDLGILERAWRGVAGAISDAWEAMKQFGAGGDVKLQKDIANVQDILKSGMAPGSGFGGEAFRPLTEQERAAYQRQLTQLQATQTAHQQAAKAAGEQARAEQAAAEASNRVWAASGENLTRFQNHVAAYKRDIETMRKAGLAVPTAAEQASHIKKLRQQDLPDTVAAENKAKSAAESAAKSAATRAANLAREARATDATTQANLDLAAAYGVSGAEAVRAQARVDAVGKAITKRADVEAYIQRQLDLNAAKAAAQGAQQVAAMDFETKARERLRAQVAAGTLTQQAADDQLKVELALRPLQDQADAAQGASKAALLKVIEDLRAAIKAANTEARQEAVSPALRKAFDAIKEADAASVFADQAGMMADSASRIGDSLEDAFGRGGSALAQLMDAMAGFEAQSAAINAQRAGSAATLAQAEADYASKAVKTAQDTFNIERARQKASADEAKTSRQLKTLEVERNVAAIDGVKSLLSKKSAAYKILTGLEIALQAVELAGHLKRLAMDAVETVKDIASIAIKGTKAVINAMASMPFPLNLAAAAATAAAVIAFGGKLLGGGGGGGGGGGVSAEERQETQGTGSVLGDSKAKSESISRSLNIVASNTNKDLEYSNDMVRSLHSIDQNIGALTNVLARQLGVSGGMFDTSGLGLGTKTGYSGISGMLGLGLIGALADKIPIIGGIFKSLFGTKKTTTLLDQGLSFDAQTLQDVLANGIDGQSFQDVQIKKKSKFFGISTGTSTKTKTYESALSDDIQAELSRVVLSLRDGVLSAASVLGVEGAKAALDAFTIDIGKISFKDMTGQEIQDTLNAVFGKLGDDLAATAIPAIEELQKAGEGAFETLVRVARQYQVIDVTLSSIGKTFGAAGVASLELRENLIDLFGSLDDFVEQTNYFAEHFLSEGERMKPIQAAVVKEFERLGVTGVNTQDQFKQLVLGLDLTTRAGQEMYASLLALAPAFDKVFTYLNPDAADAAADGWKSVFESMQDWIRSLNDEIAGSVQTTAQAYSALQAAAMAAQGGDLTAAGRVQDLGNAYLSSVKASATSDFEYLQAVARVRAIASQLQLVAASNAGMTTGAGATTPFSPATSATGSTAPSYTYTPKPAFDTTGSFTVAGTGPQDFGPVTLHGGEIVDVRRPYQSSNDNGDLCAVVEALRAEVAEFRAEQRSIGTQIVVNTDRSATKVEKFDADGLPPERDEAAA
jgi:hypothetical protein